MKDIAGMLQKAQALQAKMTELQAELKTLAAFNDARGKVTRMVEEEMNKVGGGLGLPKGLF